VNDLLARIDAQARATPERIAHRSEGRALSYGELRRRSDALAAHLAATLPDDASPVVVHGHKEPELLVAFVACAKAGHPYAPVDTAQPPQRLARIVEVSGARLVLTPERVAALSDGDSVPPARAPQPADPYYVMFTSGSTGEPKGVVITRANLACFLDWMLAEHAFADGEVFLNQVPYSFDVSHMDTYPALLCGGTVVSITRAEVAAPKRLFQTLAESGLTTWVSTPSFALLCLAERRFTREMLPRLRRFVFCGETLPPEVVAQLLARFPGAEVWNTYGPTETTVAVTSIRVDATLLARYSPLPIGRAMPGTRVAVLDDAGQPVPPGERGELAIAGPTVSPGYLGRPDLTARAFFTLDDQPAYRTGDWGRERDGLLFCEGRRDHQVKLHGYRIELGDVEAHLRGLPGVQDAVVLPSPRAGRAEALVAFVVAAAAPEAGDAFERGLRLTAQLAERLPAYMLPRSVQFLERFPMTANGKVDRRALAERLP